MCRTWIAIAAMVVASCSGAGGAAEGTGALLDAPSISTIVPDSFPPSTNLQPMTINGSGFTPDATLDFVPAHGASFQSTSSRLIHVSSSQLVYKLNNNGDAGPWSVFVATADGRRSNSLVFTVR